MTKVFDRIDTPKGKAVLVYRPCSYKKELAWCLEEYDFFESLEIMGEDYNWPIKRTESAMSLYGPLPKRFQEAWGEGELQYA